MLRPSLIGSLLLALASLAQAQVPTEQLTKPPAAATHYIIQSTGGKHGDSWLWTTADGTRMSRESFNLRGQVFEYVGSSRVDLQACKLEYSIVSPK